MRRLRNKAVAHISLKRIGPMETYSFITLGLIALSMLCPFSVLAVPKIVFENDKYLYFVSPQMDILQNESAELTIEQVSAPGYEDRWKPNTSGKLFFGDTDSTIWARFELDSTQMENRHLKWYLEFAWPMLGPCWIIYRYFGKEKAASSQWNTKGEIRLHTSEDRSILDLSRFLSTAINRMEHTTSG